MSFYEFPIKPSFYKGVFTAVYAWQHSFSGNHYIMKYSHCIPVGSITLW